MIKVRLAFTALLLVAGALSACGSSPATAQEAVVAASNKTTDARTAKIAQTVSTTGATVINTTATGVIDFIGRRASLDLTVAGHAATVVTDGMTIYERIPDLAKSLGNKPWIKLDLDKVGELAGISGLGSLATSNNDPNTALQSLRGAGSVTELGPDTVRGTDAVHYRAVIDFATAARNAPAAQQATIRQIASMLGTATQPVEIWLDQQGRVRRLLETIDYSHATFPGVKAADLPKSATITVEYYDFGTPVKVEIPAADQVTDVGAALGGAKTTPTVAPSSVTASLERRLLAAGPAGYVRQPDADSDAGPSDLAKAVRDDDEADARQVLTSAGFVAGYQRVWATGESQLIDFVYQFRTAAGAASYFKRSLTDVASASDGVTPTEFAVTGVPGAKGYILRAAEGTSAIVLLTRNGYLAQLVLVHDATAAVANQLATQQYAKLA